MEPPTKGFDDNIDNYISNPNDVTDTTPADVQASKSTPNIDNAADIDICTSIPIIINQVLTTPDPCTTITTTVKSTTPTSANSPVLTTPNPFTLTTTTTESVIPNPTTGSNTLNVQWEPNIAIKTENDGILNVEWDNSGIPIFVDKYFALCSLNCCLLV